MSLIKVVLGELTTQRIIFTGKLKLQKAKLCVFLKFIKTLLLVTLTNGVTINKTIDPKLE